jgi:threonine dehydrogenase-like Zn-dependent dehydrogenase
MPSPSRPHILPGLRRAGVTVLALVLVVFIGSFFIDEPLRRVVVRQMSQQLKGVQRGHPEAQLPSDRTVEELKQRTGGRGPDLCIDAVGRGARNHPVSHRLPLSQAPEAYRMWNDKTDDCTKLVLDPAA